MRELALSTSWNSDHHDDGVKLIKELLDLGFKSFELSFALSKEMVDDIAKLKEKGNIEVVSLHNYCPAADGFDRKKALPDCVSLASQDKDERKKAIELTKRSIDTAKRFQARVLVLHCGRIEITDRTKQLMKLYKEGKVQTQEYKDALKSLMEERKANKEPYLNSAFESLDEIADCACKKNVLLGIENRIYYREIPSFGEIELILDKFKSRNVRYWHDVGHAQVREALGFKKHQDYLNKYGNEIIGFHLHDVEGIKDHRAPLRGLFDFTRILPYVSKESIKVLETHSPATASDVIQAKKYLTIMLDGRL